MSEHVSSPGGESSFSHRDLLTQPDAAPAPTEAEDREVVPHDQNHAAEIAQFIATNERLADPTMRRDYFAQLDETGFVELLQQTAALVRTGEATNLQHFDGHLVVLSGVEVPDQREKEELLKETWRTARTFLLDPAIPDQDALDYAALTAAGGTLYAHPYADGNGRVSRITSYMIARGKTDPAEIQGILGHYGGEDWKTAPLRLVTSPQTAFGGEQPSAIEWEDELGGYGEDALGGVIANSHMHQNRVVRRFIETQGEAAKPALAESLRPGNGRTVLDGEKFVHELVHDPAAGMSNASALLDLYREARADFVHRFLQAMQSDVPVQPVQRLTNLTTPRGDQELSDVGQALQRLMAERAVNGLLKPRDQQLIMHRASSRLVSRWGSA